MDIVTALNKLHSDKRTGDSKASVDNRSEYQRDFDRIIFSSPFRRLQNKTQVFPLPGSAFVHNRLTHSLEVASVGRSLGHMVGKYIVDKYPTLNEKSKEFYKDHFYNVLASACLCHDIGNPAFGHSGEDAIRNFFIANSGYKFKGGAKLKSKFTPQQWNDLIHFEGNANAIRVLTNSISDSSGGGLKLTYSTLASIIKYPYESNSKRKKFGFLQSEKKTFLEIAKNTNMIRSTTKPLEYKRHPFVYLVEVADDICYNIIDLEDAHRLKIIEHSECERLLQELIVCLDYYKRKDIESHLKSIENSNEKISYLRAKSISSLIQESKKVYQNNFESILMGNYTTSLYKEILSMCSGLQEIEDYSIREIYNHQSVIKIENAGFNVIGELLSHLIIPILKTDKEKSKFDEKALKILPKEYCFTSGDSYEKVLGVLDYVSGMTDNYATDLYRKIKGIDIGMTI